MTEQTRDSASEADDEAVLVVGKAPVEIAGVIGEDTRKRIRRTSVAPFRLICALEIAGVHGGLVGTAWYAGPKTLITAGHCVYDPEQIGGWAREIVVTPGRDGERRPFGAQKATRFSAHPKWIAEMNPNFDIAAIHLEAALPPEATPFKVQPMDDADLKNALVNVSGYPADRGFGTEQWWAKNRIQRVRPDRLYYDVDTYGGQSGAPLYVIPNARAAPIVVGVHAYGLGGPPGEDGLPVNSAPRITKAIHTQIKAWIGA